MKLLELNIPQFSQEKLNSNLLLPNETLEAILLNLVFYFNDNINGFNKLEENNDLKKIIMQGIIFNFFMIGQLIKILGFSFSNPEVKSLRDCIAHFDERVKKFYSLENIEKINLSTDKIQTFNGCTRISGLHLNGVNCEIVGGKSKVSSPFGIFDNQLIGLDKEGKTIAIVIDIHLFKSYRKEIEKIFQKYIKN